MNTTVELDKLQPLFDADILVYRCGFAADSQVSKEYLEAYPASTPEEVAEYRNSLDYTAFALGNVKSVVQEVLSIFAPQYRMFITGSGNFRDQLATIQKYKGNRDTLHKPKYYDEIKQYLRDVWKAEVIEGREADDALGCAQWAAKGRNTVIVTIDKDLNMIPGWHYNWVKKEFYDVSMFDANVFFFRQMLEGDKTDNIPGIKGVGPKTIDKLFKDLTSLEDIRTIVQDQYKKQYGNDWEEAYTEVAALLWMERIDGHKCPFLWN